MNLHQKIMKLMKANALVAKDFQEESFSPEYVRAFQTFSYEKGGKFAMYATRFPTEEVLPLEVKEEIDVLVKKLSIKKVEKPVEKIVIEKKKEEKVEDVKDTAPVSVEPVKEEKTGFFSKKNKNKKK